jgi:hypothetical protein
MRADKKVQGAEKLDRRKVSLKWWFLIILE